MSFRRFVVCCAVCGAWFAFLGWAVGVVVAWIIDRFIAGEPSPETAALVHAAQLGLCLGLAVALGLSILDALWNIPPRHFGQIIPRVLAALAVGTVGGLGGAVIGQLLFGWTRLSIFFFFGWTIVGLLVGASLAAFELVQGVRQRQRLPAALKKLCKCILGGTLGGLLGGAIAFALRSLATVVFVDKDVDRLLSPTALGFVALGACIGLLIGLAQVLLKDAWIRVEAGFRAGRELILTKDRTSVGRAEGSDIPLFGDAAVEKVHAFILAAGDRFYLEEAGPTQGTYVNDRKLAGRCELVSGDVIRIGRSVLRFSQRRRAVAVPGAVVPSHRAEPVPAPQAKASVEPAPGQPAAAAAVTAPIPEPSQPRETAAAVSRWYLARQGKTYGPYPLASLQAMAKSRQLLGSDLLCAEGSQQWAPAPQVPGLFTPAAARVAAAPSATPAGGGQLLLSSGKTLALVLGTKLAAADLPGLEPLADPIVAEVIANPAAPGMLGLSNQSRQSWSATQANGAQLVVRPGQTLPLGHGTRINFGRIQGTIAVAQPVSAGT